uniref:BZIP transcription factor 1 n=1 Tax=Chlorella sp. HS2 TaxID=2675547 RepID=A0A8E4HJG8_9CHLO|nr:bZIP transcription factor 1 [Chlorella sp. HS2]
MLSPESQKRERRRIANRDCARRIRQRKTELLADLTASVEQLQADNARLLATLTEVTRCWRDTTLENCELRARIALLQAGRLSAGGCSSGGTGGSSGLPSPVGLGAQLGSPGWPLPMVL